LDWFLGFGPGFFVSLLGVFGKSIVLLQIGKLVLTLMMLAASSIAAS